MPSDDVIVACTEAIRAEPLATSLWFSRGIALYKEGDFDGAISDFTQIISLDPISPQAYQSRGLAWYSKGDYDRAIADYDDAIRTGPKYIRSYYNRGLAWERKKQLDKALADYRLLSELDPSFLDAQKAVARVTAVLKEKADAEEQYKRKFQTPSAVLPPEVMLAKQSAAQATTAAQPATETCLKESGEKAIAACDEAIKQNPRDDRAYSARGRAWASKRDFDKAVADFSEVMRLSVPTAKSYADRGNVWLMKREYNKAIADYGEAIKLAPEAASLYSNRGSAWAYKGETDKAIDDLNEAIRLNPQSSTAFGFRGWMWGIKGEESKAIADLDEAIKLNPQNSTAYNNRCNFYRRKLNFAPAMRDCNEAIKIDLKNSWALDSRGDLWKDMKNYDAAIIDYKAALKENSEFVPTYFNLGLAYEMKGDLANALHFYRQYNSLNPSDSRAVEALARLANLPQNDQIVSAGLEADKLNNLSTVAVTNQAHRVALVIGNGNYQNHPPLVNPANDVSLLATSLRTAGFQSVIVKTDQTREKLIATIRAFATLADSSDWAVIYYSGHGIEYNGINYLIPVDARLGADRDIDLEAVDVNKITAAIEGAKRLRLLILDSCRTNPFVGGMRRTVASRSVGRGLAAMEPEAGTLVVFAAKHGQEALDGEGKNSPFAMALVKRMQTPNLDVRRLFDLVRDDVMARTNRKQQPFSYGSLSGSEDFFFVKK